MGQKSVDVHVVWPVVWKGGEELIEQLFEGFIEVVNPVELMMGDQLAFRPIDSHAEVQIFQKYDHPACFVTSESIPISVINGILLLQYQSISRSA